MKFGTGSSSHVDGASESVTELELGRRARDAAKWSLITEAAAKIITPATQLVLARILAPSAFGILATVVMVQSFAVMLSDAGFQKYLVQREFRDQRSLFRAASVAFWSSMFVAVTLLLMIVLARDRLASMVGSPGLGIPIAVAALSLPLSAFVGNQQALFRRAFEYKRLVPRRVVVALIPLAVSVPLALLGLGYWSLIAGILAAATADAAIMAALSQWKPVLFFSFPILKEMFAFSVWSLVEAIAIWATLWSGTFVVGSLLTPHDLGLYRQSILVVNSGFALVTTATTPILFAALSRLQSSPHEYRRFFFRFQFTVSALLFPVGVGAFFYREFLTTVLFGEQWAGASLMFGAWSLTSSLNIIFAHYCSEIFRSLGRPRVSVLSQCLYMAVMIPSLYFAAHHGFHTLVIVNAAVRTVQILIAQALAYSVAGIGFLHVLRNVHAPLCATAVMGIAAVWSAQLAQDSWGWSVIGILACACVYGLSCLCFSGTRALTLRVVGTLRRRLA